MGEKTLRHEAQAVAGNLATLWEGGRPALDIITAADGVRSATPWASLHKLSDEQLATAFDGPNRHVLENAAGRLERYLATETWFDRAVRSKGELQRLRRHPVAYLCMEFGLANWLQIYSGGLGVLAGDVLKESSDLGLPLVGVGLLYRRGFFQQRLDDSGMQTEITPDIDPADLPLSRTMEPDGRPLMVTVPFGSRPVFAQVWKLTVGRTPLYLLDTDVPENTREDDRLVTAALYGGDAETRMRQEIVLGIGGVRALRRLGIEPAVYGMNEGHAGFLGLELVAETHAGREWSSALRTVRERVVYTNHTVVPAGNDVFPTELVRAYLEPYADDQGIGIDRLLDLGGGKSPGGFSMAVLAFQLSGKANAVSQLHAEVIPREWPGYAVEVVTNGVHIPTWIGDDVAETLNRFVPNWRDDQPSWDDIESIPAAELWAVRNRQRQALIRFVNANRPETPLDPEVLTIVWARRFAEYKRANLITFDLPRLTRLMSDSDRPVQLILAGKAHPRDLEGKRIMQGLLQQLRSEAGIAARLAFVENYDLEVARVLVAGADVWLNTPRRPLEASGTSGMKSSDNGGLQLTVRDGWSAEVDWWNVGWGIDGVDDRTDAQQLYSYLELGVIPTFYTRTQDGIPEDWVNRMRHTMVISLSRFSARRMMLDYVNKLYLPLLREQVVLAVAAE